MVESESSVTLEKPFVEQLENRAKGYADKYQELKNDGHDIAAKDRKHSAWEVVRIIGFLAGEERQKETRDYLRDNGL